MNVGNIWPFAQISDEFYYLGIWQCDRYFVAALLKKLALSTTRKNVRSRVSVSAFVTMSRSRSLSQVSVSEVTVSTTPLTSASNLLADHSPRIAGCLKSFFAT